MDRKITALLGDEIIGELLKVGTGSEFRYFTDEIEKSIAISLPSTGLTYRSHTGLIPLFDMFIPEGFLFQYLKEAIHKKEGEISDFIILWYLAEGIKSKAKFKGRQIDNINKRKITMEELEENDTYDLFLELLKIFLDKNAIGGIQPKTVAVVEDKANILIFD